MEFFHSVMLSEVRRQPNGVEAPHTPVQLLQPVEAFPARLIVLRSTLLETSPVITFLSQVLPLRIT